MPQSNSACTSQVLSLRAPASVCHERHPRAATTEPSSSSIRVPQWETPKGRNYRACMPHPESGHHNKRSHRMQQRYCTLQWRTEGQINCKHFLKNESLKKKNNTLLILGPKWGLQLHEISVNSSAAVWIMLRLYVVHNREMYYRLYISILNKARWKLS